MDTITSLDLIVWRMKHPGKVSVRVEYLCMDKQANQDNQINLTVDFVSEIRFEYYKPEEVRRVQKLLGFGSYDSEGNYHVCDGQGNYTIQFARNKPILHDIDCDLNEYSLVPHQWNEGLLWSHCVDIIYPGALDTLAPKDMRNFRVRKEYFSKVKPLDKDIVLHIKYSDETID